MSRQNKSLSESINSRPATSPIYPLMIAEAGVNHEGSMELAKRLIEEAATGGADAIKFQTYKAESLASKDSPAYWDQSFESTSSQYELFKKHDSFWKNEFESLKKICEQQNIEFLSTAFDVESATFLNDLMDIHKISSSDLNNRPFIEFLASFGKPILLSTGAAELHEIVETCSWIEESGVPYSLLHCVLNYPTPDENAHLAMITGLKNHFPNTIIGYSDHTMPGDMQNLEIATTLGAEIIEKHFTHDKTLPGNDHYHAMDHHDLKRFHERMKHLFTCLGNSKVSSLKEEASARLNARRSLVSTRDIKKGEHIKKEDLTWKRPAHGITPKLISELIGKVALSDIPEDTVLQWNLFS